MIFLKLKLVELINGHAENIREISNNERDLDFPTNEELEDNQDLVNYLTDEIERHEINDEAYDEPFISLKNNKAFMFLDINYSTNDYGEEVTHQLVLEITQ